MIRRYGVILTAGGTCLALSGQIFLLLNGPSSPALFGRMVALCLLGGLTAALATLTAVLFYQGRLHRSSVERSQFYLLSRFANTYLFEYRFRARILTFSDNLPALLGLESQLEGPCCSARMRELVHPDDLHKLSRLAANPPAPRKEAALELRLLHRGGGYTWYECRSVATYDKHGRASTLLGRFENIDSRKRRETNLVARSIRDDLTGLLNRSAITLRVEEWIHSPRAQEGGALFMLDLDDFKSINDTVGHAGGDRALLLTSQVLRETFRSTDILGRAGGDEFLVFMTGVQDPNVAAERAETLCRALSERSCQGDGCAPLSCSVGVSLFPRDGESYPALFEAADAAMYHAKRQGKSSYRFTSAVGAEVD